MNFEFLEEADLLNLDKLEDSIWANPYPIESSGYSQINTDIEYRSNKKSKPNNYDSHDTIITSI